MCLWDGREDRLCGRVSVCLGYFNFSPQEGRNYLYERLHFKKNFHSDVIKEKDVVPFRRFNVLLFPGKFVLSEGKTAS